MSDKTKKIIFAVFFVILSIAIGFGLYFFFFKPLFVPTEVAQQTPEELAGTLPTAGTGTTRPPTTEQAPGALPSAQQVTTAPVAATQAEPKVFLLRDGVTQAVVPSTDGQGARFYNPEDGRFYKVNADGTISLLNGKQFLNVSNVNWAKRNDQAIMEFPDGNNVFYDFKSSRQVTLPKHWEDFDFSPDDKNIVAKSIGLDPSSRFLLVSDPTGNEAKAIEPLGANANRVISSWSPNNQVVGFAMTGEPQSEGAQEVYLIGENRENFKSLIVPGRGFMPNWSPTGKQILYSVYHERNDLKPSLWVAGGIADQIGENRRGLNLNTWADKCAWKNESELICGVPQSLGLGAGLDPQKYTSTPDDVYRVDLRTGVSTKINTPEQIHPIRNPVLSADKSKLIFTSGSSGRLYEYVLP
jgi:Tol biopolymer transport system component